MPELPDVVVYVEALEARLKGRPLEGVRLASPFLLRTVDPPLSDFVGKRMLGIERLGKRLVFAFEGELFLVLHLMIAGRLHWREPGRRLAGKLQLAAYDFEHGALVLTEAGTKKRASLHAVRGRAGLAQHDRGGLEVLDATVEVFRASLARENRTLKRALTDPTHFSGIGNAYSDEILHAARLSPFLLTRSLDDEQSARLFDAARRTLTEWTDRLRKAANGAFPEKVTAFRPEMAVHGKHGNPCPICGAPVQRIAYADNECNYCARCQTDGRLLADRALSRLLKDDWPRTLEELEERRRRL